MRNNGARNERLDGLISHKSPGRVYTAEQEMGFFQVDFSLTTIAFRKDILGLPIN